MSDRIVPIRSDGDIVGARLAARSLAEDLGFTGSDLVLIATAVSEVARNIVEYAGNGEVELGTHKDGGKKGLVIIARDKGPGIEDVSRAMQVGFTTSRGLGLGLPGAKRLMDDFGIVSRMGSGTTVTMRKWLRGKDRG